MKLSSCSRAESQASLSGIAGVTRVRKFRASASPPSVNPPAHIPTCVDLSNVELSGVYLDDINLIQPTWTAT